jgi:curved DNA binding protein
VSSLFLTKVFNKKKAKQYERGIAFPTCLCINEVAGHFSPMQEDTVVLKNEDVVSIDCGTHFDGYASLAANTIVVGGSTKARKADTVLAAHNALLAVAKSMKPGVKNSELTAKIQACCNEFKCEPLHGVLSYKNKRHMVDGGDCIMNKDIPDQKPKDWELVPGDVICLDIYASSGSGKSKQAVTRTTVYKRELDQQYQLKSKHARTFFNVVNKKHPTMPFSISKFEDAGGTKVGIKECVEHSMLEPYPVLTEAAGEIVAQFKATVVVQPNSTVIIAGGQGLQGEYKSEHSIKDADLKAVIAGDFWKNDKKAEKAKKKAAGEPEKK